MCICIYVCFCICVCMYICIYIYTHTHVYLQQEFHKTNQRKHPESNQLKITQENISEPKNMNLKLKRLTECSAQ